MSMIHISGDVLTHIEETARMDMMALSVVPHSFHTPKTVGNEYENRVMGLMGETALKLFLNLDWRTHAGFGPDVDDFYEVRTTSRADGGLFTHRTDRLAVFVLAQYIDKRHIRLAGWIRTNDANTETHWADWLPHPAFLTPADELNPMTTLPRKVLA